MKYIRELEINPFLEASIQFIVLKKTLVSISLDRRLGHYQKDVGEYEIDKNIEI